MIREHAFNSAWWGARAGIVDSSEFFSLNAAAQDEALREFAWVEFRASLHSVPPAPVMLRAGFAAVDTQVNFRIGLKGIPPLPDSHLLEVRFADETPFSVADGEPMSFEHERYQELPGITAARLNDRYVRWANLLIDESPAWCLRVLRGSETQGWFLSRAAKPGLNLALAMLRHDATISGMHLYQEALRAYARRGMSVGWASFSVRNVDVHNIYARLGAHFTSPTGQWLWQPRP